MNYNDPTFEEAKRQANNLAVIGLIFAIFFPIVGLILCIKANKDLEKIGEKKNAAATFGTVISALQVIGTIALFGIVIFMVGTSFNGEITNEENNRNPEYNEKCQYAVCQNDCIGPNCTCTYTDEEGNTYEIYCG